MKKYIFKEAQAVWLERREEDGSQLAGFFTHLSIENEIRGTLAIGVRSYYRLYINGEMYANGPARTAQGYSRVDVIPLKLSGEMDLAIEVAAYSKPEKYCNDNTMEPGLLIAEVVDALGKVCAATGKDGWSCGELGYRRMNVELMSHCCGIVEYYDLSPDSGKWKVSGLPKKPALVAEPVTYLARQAPMACCDRNAMDAVSRDLGRKIMHTMVQISDRTGKAPIANGSVMGLSRIVNPGWYKKVPPENCFLEELIWEEDAPFSGTWKKENHVSGRQYIRLMPGKGPAAVLWQMGGSEVGYLDFDIEVEQEAVVDIVHSDCLDRRGRLRGNTYAARYCLKAGEYHLTSFEPKLVKYAQFILRTAGGVRMSYPDVLADTYQDKGDIYFECNDGDLNRIYEASRKTLRLNTLDLFMDCPERERGGWLCDSYFSARGAWQMFGDLSVEQDFLENFMLTDGEHMWHGFFPEVYPGVRGRGTDVGIRNWSFWLALEVCDYYRRSGDRERIVSAYLKPIRPLQIADKFAVFFRSRMCRCRFRIIRLISNRHN